MPRTYISPLPPFFLFSFHSLRPGTFVAVWWTAAALHLKAVEVSASLGLRVAAELHSPIEGPPTAATGLSPVAALSDNLLVVTWRAAMTGASGVKRILQCTLCLVI